MSPTNFIYKTLTTRIAPMVYIMMFVNVLIGLFFFTGVFMGPGESILYSTGVLVDKNIWGGLLFLTSSICLFGMIRKNDNLMQFGGIAGFMLWLFATIALTLTGHWYILLTQALFHLLFHGYVYLATTTGVIYRATITGG